MDSLKARLENIMKESEKKQSGIIYIYDIIEQDFAKYCEIFSIDPNSDVAKDELYCKLMITIHELTEDDARIIGMNAYIRKLGDKGSAPKFKLGWAELQCTMSEQGIKEMCRREILESKKSKFHQSIIKSIMGKEAKIVIEEEEIRSYANERAWPHSSCLTQKGIDIIDGYHNATGQPSIEKIRAQTRESYEDLINS